MTALCSSTARTLPPESERSARIIWTLSALLVLLALPLSGCVLPSWEWHQKLTVVVDTPAGERSGSAVIYEKVLLGQLPAMANGISYTIRGEATVVEVAPGRYMFAVLSGLKTEALASTVYRKNRNDDAEVTFDYVVKTRESRLVPRNMYPLLVTFYDINDPRTVREVDPDDLARTFGPGYSLKRIEVQITDEPLTNEIVKLLPWFERHLDVYFDGSKFSNVQNPNLSNHLGSSHFKTER
ncbi:MAG: hypothetical protein LCH46_04860 [Proteobacteria bacterium]|nr:hypothetical protein [Pseudomonadota bacterium]